MNWSSREFRRVRGAWVVVALALLPILLFAPGASGAAQPLTGGELLLTLNSGLDTALRQESAAIDAVNPAARVGRRLTVPVSSGSFDADADSATFGLSGSLKLRHGRDTVVVRKIKLDTVGKRLSATVAGRRIQLALLRRSDLAREGFGARLEVRRLLLTRAGAAALNRVLALPDVLRAGRSLGSLNAFGEPSAVEVGFGRFSLGGPETTFAKLRSIDVQIGGWGASEQWGEGAERYFLFQVESTTIPTDASAGLLAGAANDGISFEIHASPPRNMLLRGPRIDLATRELSATLSPLWTEGPFTATIAALDFGGAEIQVRPKVGAIELTGLRAVANQLLADQLNTRFATNIFQAGETFARLTVTLNAVG